MPPVAARVQEPELQVHQGLSLSLYIYIYVYIDNNNKLHVISYCTLYNCTLLYHIRASAPVLSPASTAGSLYINKTVCVYIYIYIHMYTCVNMYT